jgi:tryptophanyl-tRNA synthetase
MAIYSQFSGLTLAEIEKKYEGEMYGTFKKELAEVVVGFIEPLQQRYHDIRQSGELTSILAQGAERAREEAAKTIKEVRHLMGFLPR